MFDLPWPQISGAVAGGVVGGFSGFVANKLQDRRELRRARQNVASALIGEISAVSHYIETHYLISPREDREARELRDASRRHFRAERDYMPVFRSLGSHVGLLPSPLPRELVSWYTRFAICLERARELHDLERQRDPDTMGYAIELAQIHEANLAELVALAPQLIADLESL